MTDRPKCFGKIDPKNLIPCVYCVEVSACWEQTIQNRIERIKR